jgi:hypothetical protein
VPAVSKAQHNFFEMLKNNPKMAKQKGVSQKVAEDFSKNSPKGLPERVAKVNALKKAKPSSVNSDDPADGL